MAAPTVGKDIHILFRFPSMTQILTKVTAYITCEGKLLIFNHGDCPEAGIQVLFELFWIKISEGFPTLTGRLGDLLHLL
jgi:hypothetical protein